MTGPGVCPGCQPLGIPVTPACYAQLACPGHALSFHIQTAGVFLRTDTVGLRHQEHFRSCDCLLDPAADGCCRLNCQCHTVQQAAA